MKKRTGVLLCGALIVLFLAVVWRLTSREAEDGPVTLRVWVERTQDPSSYNVQGHAIEDAILEAASRYEEAHENVQVELEYLPVTSVEDRQLAVQRIQNEILGGGGPDLFLSAVAIEKWGSGVFDDVEGSMRDGLFYDVSGYLEGDEALLGNLNDSVMAAGRLGEAQYVLPMRYTFPVVFVNRKAMREAGLDIESLSRNAYDLYDALLDTGDPRWTQGALPSRGGYAFSAFGDVFDYESGSVLLSTEQLERHTGYQEALSGDSPAYSYVMRYINSAQCSIGTYSYSRYFETPEGWDTEEVETESYLSVESLNNVIGMAAVSKLRSSLDVAAYPLGGVDGSVIADVTYWGAVSANTKHPQEAYDFLRLMLEPEAQSVVAEDYGWPVRTDVTLDMIWTNYWNAIKKKREEYDPRPESKVEQEKLRRATLLMKVELSEEDFPLAEVEIGKARFCTYLEYESGFLDMYGGENGDGAEGLYEKLLWHMAER